MAARPRSSSPPTIWPPSRRPSRSLEHLALPKPLVRALPTPPQTAPLTTTHSNPATGSPEWRSGTRFESRLEPNAVSSGYQRRSPRPVSSSLSGLSVTIYSEWANPSAASWAACTLLAEGITGRSTASWKTHARWRSCMSLDAATSTGDEAASPPTHRSARETEWTRASSAGWTRPVISG